MGNILVAYKTKYGSTRQYAEWIADALKTKAYDIKEVDKDMIRSADMIIFGGYIHVGKIQGVKFLERNWSVLKNKNCILYSVSATPIDHDELMKYYTGSIPEEIRLKAKYFPLPGRLAKLDWIDRLLMTMPRSSAKREYEKDPTAENMKKLDRTYSFDDVKKENIKVLIEYANSLNAVQKKTKKIVKKR